MSSMPHFPESPGNVGNTLGPPNPPKVKTMPGMTPKRPLNSRCFLTPARTICARRYWMVAVLLCGLMTPLLSTAKEVLLQTTANPDIRQGYVDAPMGQVHYWTAGEGPVLLLVHQSSSTVEEYAGLVPYLADHYRLVTWDWPGHGLSDDPLEELGVAGYTAAGLAVLDHLGIEKFHVLGHHGGALVAMNLAWQHADRVNRVILSGTSGVKPPEDIEKFTESLDLEERNRLDRDGRSLSDAWGRYLGYLPDSAPEEILVPYVANVANRLRPYDAHFGVLRWDRRPALAGIADKHILLMQGSRDDFVSRQETLLEQLPNARRVVIDDAGAFMFFEKPGEIAAEVAGFLGED